MIKVFYYVILVILSLLAISDAKRRLSFENKDDERLMMTILEKRERQKETIRKVIHRHLHEIDSHESRFEVMKEEEYERAVNTLNIYQDMLDEMEKPKRTNWHDEIKRESDKKKNGDDCFKDLVNRCSETLCDRAILHDYVMMLNKCL
mmetsp:Transcript_50955/g.61401  ORF Transcript_50955/g.61401 Transcript_50955/m.61401 type:complete len:148 (-) Transcript_50955:81-524(-)